MKKIVKILITILIIGFFFFRYFFYMDIKHDCYISILPSLELSNVNIGNALGILKRVSFDDYKEVCRYVTKVNPNFSCGGMGGGCAYQSIPKTIDISTSMDDLAWSAAIIAHETCHAKQFQEQKTISEDECYKVDDRIIKKIIKY